MFQRSTSDSRVILILDISHLFFKFAYGTGGTSMTSTVMVDGVPTKIDTKIPALTIKTIHRWSNGGINPTVVCFDSVGCSRCRKGYFASKNGIAKGGSEAVGYKSSRDKRQSDGFFDSINLTMNLLRKGGVTVLKGEGYEADDLVKAAVDRAKVDYPDLPIHVVTGDADLVPLVDEQVSVFLTSRKTTYAECKAWEKNHYVQITPKNYQEILEDLSSYRTIKVPYNTLLLAKCLRGDKSDDIAGYPKFTPTKYNALMQSLIDDGYDLSELCRYDEPTTTICYRDTEKPIPLDLISSTPNENKMIIYGEPKKCTELCKVLSNYLDEDIVEHVRFVYNGINLNCAFTNLPDVFKRRPAKLSNQIMGYSAAELQKAVSVVQINLPMI